MGSSASSRNHRPVWTPSDGPPPVQDFLPDELAEQPPARATKVIDAAKANGWIPGPTSLAVRFDHPEGRPIYARWDLEYDEQNKPRWRFGSARANNGQKMTYNDIFTVLEHPEALEPEPPEAKDDIPEAIREGLAFEEISGDRSERYTEGWDKPVVREAKQPKKWGR